MAWSMALGFGTTKVLGSNLLPSKPQTFNPKAPLYVLCHWAWLEDKLPKAFCVESLLLLT